MEELPPFRTVVSQRRKNTALRIGSDGILEVLVPAGMREEKIRELLKSNMRIVEKLFRKAASEEPRKTFSFTEGELFPFAGKTLKLKFSARIAMIHGDELIVPAAPPEQVRASIEKLYRAAAYGLLKEKCLFYGAPRGLIPQSIGITGAETRWGSCSSKKHISFCWKLLLIPEELIDYVVCHELAHLKELNHSPAFWRLAEQLCPGAAAKRARLKALPLPWL